MCSYSLIMLFILGVALNAFLKRFLVLFRRRYCQSRGRGPFAVRLLNLRRDYLTVYAHVTANARTVVRVNVTRRTRANVLGTVMECSRNQPTNMEFDRRLLSTER